MTNPPLATAAEEPPANVASAIRRLGVPALIVLLLVGYAALSLSASRHKGPAFDEAEHVAIGYNMWLRHDFRMECANGDLVKRWATLPLLHLQPPFVPTSDPFWRAGGPYEVAFRFFFRLGNDPHRLLFVCRAMVAVIGVATALLVFFISRRLFGIVGGFVSLILFVSSPSMLAYGAIVSTEMTTCLTLLGCAWATWQLMQRVTWPRLGGSLLFGALLVLSKPTAVVMIPLTVLMILVKLSVGRPIVVELGAPRTVATRWGQGRLFALLAILHVAVAWAAIWTAYDFRYAASPNPADRGIAFRTQPTDPIAAPITSFLTWANHRHFLPEGYLRGIKWLLEQNESQAAFMDGRWTFGGWSTFFPYGMWVKTQPAFLLLFGLAVGAAWWQRGTRRDRPATTGPESRRELIYAATPLLGLVLVYFGIAISWDLNIGVRHILPIYPPLYVLTGSVALLWRRHWLPKIVIVLLAAWHVEVPLQIYPHFLAYFSPVAGGPSKGYQHLVDSSLDWGMDLPGFKHWLDVHNPGGSTSVFFAYFGVDDPDEYRIKAFWLPSRPNWRAGRSYPLGPGIYAISATLLQGIGTPTVGPWNKAYEQAYWASLQRINLFDLSLKDPAKHAALLEEFPQKLWDEEYARFEFLRFARLCAWLRHHRPPDDEVGYSILIWRLSQKEIFDIGLGAPAELAEAPLHR